MTEKKITAYVAWTNTDLTEGRGHEYPLAICTLEATAIRLGRKKYVQGTDCRITECELIRRNNMWYGPVWVRYPDREDEARQKEITARHIAVKKAIDAGLTDEDIAALKA